jgi:hypothetical protein
LVRSNLVVLTEGFAEIVEGVEKNGPPTSGPERHRTPRLYEIDTTVLASTEYVQSKYAVPTRREEKRVEEKRREERGAEQVPPHPQLTESHLNGIKRDSVDRVSTPREQGVALEQRREEKNRAEESRGEDADAKQVSLHPQDTGVIPQEGGLPSEREEETPPEREEVWPDWYATLYAIPGFTTALAKCRKWLEDKGITDGYAEVTAYALKSWWPGPKRRKDRDPWDTFQNWARRDLEERKNGNRPDPPRGARNRVEARVDPEDFKGAEW